MDNTRRPIIGNAYRTGYLHSPAWFRRRRQWFSNEQAQVGWTRCAACTAPGTAEELDLHHVDYSGVRNIGGRWIAREAHTDLIPLHPACHELLHRLLDRDPVLARHRSRLDANLVALRKLREKLAPPAEVAT